MPNYLVMVEGANNWQENKRPQKDLRTIYCLLTFLEVLP